MLSESPILNALTVDVEDYFHVSAFERCVPRADWDRYPTRVVANTQRMLRHLERAGVHGTFFVLGWVARQFPALIREIADRGHQIGCHSYWHRLVYDMTPEEFRQDLRQARDVLQEITGTPVVAYRAPSWSITRKSMWALDILAEEGFRQDSSIFPIHHDRYGIPNAPRLPHRRHGLWEFPPSVFRLGPCNLPLSGGGYFRFFPLSWTIACARALNRRGKPYLFYIHPWEFDPDQPRLNGSWLSRWRHYRNLSETDARFQELLRQVRFGTMSEVLRNAQDEPNLAKAS